MSAVQERTCVIGVDLGGTNVRAQAVWEDGTEAGERVQHPSRAKEGREAVIASVADAIQKAAATARVRPAAVGLAIPGHVDDEDGYIRWSPNFGEVRNGVFYEWRDVAVKDDLQAAAGFPIVMGNDANCAALGEYMFGSGKNSAKCLAMLTLGTGVGGGVVLGPHSVMGHASGPLLLLGGNKGGAELGHILLLRGGQDCSAGSSGAVEAYCQSESIVRRAIYKFRRQPDSLIFDMTKGDLSLVTPKLIAECANAGDYQAREILREVGEWLGAAIGSLINVFAPDVFAIGGQIAKSGEWLLQPAINEARYVAIPSLFADCRIVPAEQQDDAGLLGGAALALNAVRE